MKKVSLSARHFNALKRDPKGPKVQRIWTKEFRGLGVDLGKTKKSIIYKYKSPVTGKFRLLTLDSFNYSQKLDDDLIDRIVSDHYKVKDKIRADIDPLAIKEKDRAERQQAELEARQAKEAEAGKAEKDEYTLNRAFDDYTQHRSFEVLKPRSQEAYIRCYNKVIAPALGNIPLTKIHPKRDVNVFLDSLGDSQCHMSTVVLQRIQSLAIDRDKLQHPICFNRESRKFGVREGYVEDIPAFIAFLQDNSQYQSYKNAMYAQLLYGTRANEIYNLKWSEVDFDKQVINISWERVKTRSIKKKELTPLDLPLMPAMEDILEQQKGFSDVYVFPQLMNDKPMVNSDAYYLLKRAGLPFSSHDIRRTVSYTLEEMDGVSIEDVDIILDHTIQGVNKSYIQRKKILQRKRRILSKWHSYLVEIMNSDITPINAASGGVK